MSMPPRPLHAVPVLMLLLMQPAFAQNEAGPSSVVVNGTRAGAGEASNVAAAKSKIMSRDRASSCNFMTPHNPAETAVALAYMRDFGMEGSSSNEAEHFSDLAPGGDVSDTEISSSLSGLTNTSDSSGMSTPSVGCGGADRRFAAARNRIERNDKSLAQAYEAFDNRDYARAETLFKTAYSKIGYEEAPLMLAKMRLYGMGGARNTSQGISWLRQVVDARFDPQNDRQPFDPKDPLLMSPRSEASFMLARIYERGVGVPKDAMQAIIWYQRAAEFGYVPALQILGQAALSGYGGMRNPPKGLAYFKDAAELGYVPAQYSLGKLYYNGDSGVPQDLKLAVAYFNAAAREGNPGALFAVGRMLDMGEGIPADQQKAAYYYKQAAVKGDRDAQYALGTYFYEGGIVPQDLSTARKLFDAAAKQGQPDAMFNLGAMSANGEGGPRDVVAAYVWLSLAGAAGKEDAASVLKSIGAKLTPQERARADAILKPASPAG